MKRINYPIYFLSLLLLSCNGESTDQSNEANSTPEEFTIEGHFDNLDSGYVYLKHRVEGEYIYADSIVPSNGGFSFSGSLEFPELFRIEFSGTNDRVEVFMENSDVTINGDFELLNEVEITGSSIHDNFTTIQEELGNYRSQLDEIVKAYYEADDESAEQDSLGTVYSETDSMKMVYLGNEMRTNQDNSIGPYILLSYLIYTKNLDSLKSDVAKFDSELENSKYLVELNDIINRRENVRIGKIAPDFTMNSNDDKPITMSDFRGDYLLIDFWASWCGPCRKENPNIVKQYAKYHEAGLNILGVSLDTDKEKWIEAIESDKLDWSHVSDLKGWKNEVGHLYVVRSIPHSVLLDPEGKIIAKDLRGEELELELEKILTKK